MAKTNHKFTDHANRNYYERDTEFEVLLNSLYTHVLARIESTPPEILPDHSNKIGDPYSLVTCPHHNVPGDFPIAIVML